MTKAHCKTKKKRLEGGFFGGPEARMNGDRATFTGTENAVSPKVGRRGATKTGRGIRECTGGDEGPLSRNPTCRFDGGRSNSLAGGKPAAAISTGGRTPIKIKGSPAGLLDNSGGEGGKWLRTFLDGEITRFISSRCADSWGAGPRKQNPCAGI